MLGDSGKRGGAANKRALRHCERGAGLHAREGNSGRRVIHSTRMLATTVMERWLCVSMWGYNTHGKQKPLMHMMRSAKIPFPHLKKKHESSLSKKMTTRRHLPHYLRDTLTLVLPTRRTPYAYRTCDASLTTKQKRNDEPSSSSRTVR